MLNIMVIANYYIKLTIINRCTNLLILKSNIMH